MRRRAAAVGAVLALTGCSSDTDPGPTVLPSLTASPTPTAAAIPAEAMAATPQGAAAFTRYFFEQVNQAFTELDPKPIERLSDPGCETCSNYIATIKAYGSAAQKYEGGEYRLRFAEAPPVENGDVIVDISYDRPPARLLDSAGNVVEQGPAVTGVKAQVRLSRRADGWVVRGVRRVSV